MKTIGQFCLVIKWQWWRPCTRRGCGEVSGTSGWKSLTGISDSSFRDLQKAGLGWSIDVNMRSYEIQNLTSIAFWFRGTSKIIGTSTFKHWYEINIIHYKHKSGRCLTCRVDFFAAEVPSLCCSKLFSPHYLPENVKRWHWLVQGKPIGFCWAFLRKLDILPLGGDIFERRWKCNREAKCKIRSSTLILESY